MLRGDAPHARRSTPAERAEAAAGSATCSPPTSPTTSSARASPSARPTRPSPTWSVTPRADGKRSERPHRSRNTAASPRSSTKTSSSSTSAPRSTPATSPAAPRPRRVARGANASARAPEGRSVTNGIKIAPSIVSADLSRLARPARQCERAGAGLHPHRRHGRPLRPRHHHRPARRRSDPPLAPALSSTSTSWSSSPRSRSIRFIDAGGDIINATSRPPAHIHRIVQQVHARDRKAGVCLNPGTPVTRHRRRSCRRSTR